MNIVADDGFVTELLEPGSEIPAAQQEEFLARYEKLLRESGLVILSGSVPDGIGKDIYCELIKKAKAAGVPTYLDSSSESMRCGIGAAPDLIKPNWKELEYIMGHKIADREEIVESALYLREMGIGRVVVSMGSKGLLSVSGEGIYCARTEEIKAVNTVACGDSVVASYAISMRKKENEEAAIRRACAVSAANATTIESACIPLETAKELMNRVVIEKLQ